MYKQEIKKVLWKATAALNLLLPSFLRRKHQVVLFKHLEVFTDLKDKRALIIGLGTGVEVPLFLAKGCKKVVGLDPYPAIEGKQFGRNFKLVKGTGENLPFRDRSFDIVYSVATLEHIKRPLKVVQEMMRVLKPGGLFYCQAAPLWFSHSGYHPKQKYPELNNDWFHLVQSKNEAAKSIHERNRERYKEHLTRIYESDDYNRLPGSIYYKTYSWLLERFTPLEVRFGIDTERLRNFQKENPSGYRKLVSKHKKRDLITNGFIWVFIK